LTSQTIYVCYLIVTKCDTSLEEIAKQTGLLINPQKTKTMRINTTQTDKLTIRDTEVEHVEQFTYLGSIISITGGTDEDIKARKRKAQQAFAMLKPVWRSTTLRTSTKLRLNSNVKYVLLYGSETWTETASSIKALPSLSEPLPQNYLGSEVARYHQQ
jgi:hypothetical protein